MQKSFKKTLALILSIVMIIGVLPMGLSFAAESDYTYTVTDEKVTITKYNGSDEELTIPDTLGGYPVVAIGDRAFRGNLSIKKIRLADSIETVGNLAFYQCKSLVEVNLGNGVKTLVSSAFSNCGTIDTLIIGVSLATVGASAFNGTTINVIKYKGSAEQWSAITVETSNNRFENAEKVFNYCEHVITEVPEVSAECEKPGNIQYWTCTLCNKNYSDANATTEIDVEDTIIDKKGHNYSSVVTDPTCTETGYTTYTCATCANTYTDNEVDAKGHSAGEAVRGNIVEADCINAGSYDSVVYCSVCEVELSRETVIVEALGEAGHKAAEIPSVSATCSTIGYTKGEKCSVCDKILKEQELINKIPHTEVVDEAVAATCTQSGLTEGKHCSVCNEVIVEQTVVGALNHTEVIDEAVAATCTAAGLTEGKHCLRCNEVLVEQTVIKAAGHTEVVVEAVAATCTATGLTEGKRCSVCETITASQEVVPMIAHTYSETVIVKDSTCTEKGESKKTCTDCGYVLKEEISMKEHIIDAAPSKEPTCTEAGFTGAKWCTACNNYLGEKVDIPALGHNFVKVEDKSYAATCTTEGREYKQCSRCNETENTVLAKLDHDLNTFEGKAATCTEAGYKAYETCNRCDHNTYEVIPALNHTGGADATCTTAQNCTVCGKQLVAALGHKEVVINAVEPGCETIGKTEGKVCSACGTVLTAQEDIPAIGHNYVKDTEKSQLPTCDDAGVDVKVCANCGDVKNDPINALGHDIVEHEGKAATCTEAGYKAYQTCTRCAHNTYEAIQKLGHTPDIPAATCTEAQKCVTCGKTLVEELGHVVVIVPGKEATCTENGLTDGEYCSRCNETLKEQYIIKSTGHKTKTVKGTPATCTENGLKDGVYCTACETWVIAQEVITAPGHKRMTIEEVKPTCTDKGSTEGIGCENCDYYFDEPQDIEPYGHDVVDVYGYAATCTENGLTDGKKCSRCDYYEVPQTEIPAAHKLVYIEPLAPTCTEAGHTFGQKCSVCGEFTIQPEELPATDHTEGPAATCTAPQTCTVCDAILAAAIAHTPGVAATCTAPQICIVCRNVLVEALGHDLVYDETVTKPATCYSDGYEKANCKNCDYGFSHELTKTGHKVDFWTTIEIPTCQKEGKNVGVCIECKYTIEDKLDILDHKDDNKDNKCDFCSKSMGGITWPDFGGDKEDDGKCKCNCHAVGIKGLIFDFILFLQRLFGLNRTCKCGEAHY